MSTIKRLPIFILILVAYACGSKNEHHDHDNASAKEWKEMDEFHMVMAEAFHPYKDSLNLQPAKEKAAELAAAARAWRESAAPEGDDVAGIESQLNDLVRLSEEFSAEVSSGSDEAIAGKLTAVHDLFHELQNDFYGGAAAEHGDDHEHHH
jgi:hypothetical protein